MKMTKNFKLQEFVPASVYEKYGDNSTWFIDDMLPTGAQIVRDELYTQLVKPLGEYVDLQMVINGKDRDESGFRVPSTETGQPLSQHRFGRAIDFQVLGKRNDGEWEHVPSLEIQRIISIPTVWEKLRGIWTTMEGGTLGWTHLDMRYRSASEYSKGPAIVAIPAK